MAITDTREETINKRHYRDDIKGDQCSLYLSNYPVSVNYLSERIGNPNKTYLELCCGIGITLSEMARHFKKAVGVELDAQILEYCRANLSDIVVYDIPYWVSKELSDGTNVLDKNPPFDSIVRNILNTISSDLIVFAPSYFSVENVQTLPINSSFRECMLMKSMIVIIFILGI